MAAFVLVLSRCNSNPADNAYRLTRSRHHLNPNLEGYVGKVTGAEGTRT